jgi:hypothetical protein
MTIPFIMWITMFILILTIEQLGDNNMGESCLLSNWYITTYYGCIVDAITDPITPPPST